MLLTPKQIDGDAPMQWVGMCVDEEEFHINTTYFNDMRETLLAYAEVVQDLAESCPSEPSEIYGDPICHYCGGEGLIDYIRDLKVSDGLDHYPDCLWLRARALRGLDARS